MVNHRVENVRALIAVLRAEGVQVVGEVEETEHGSFGWIMDPEGNKLELWEPPAGQ
jgi:predicted enzyme related to lactoylglutathione lyase